MSANSYLYADLDRADFSDFGIRDGDQPGLVMAIAQLLLEADPDRTWEEAFHVATEADDEIHLLCRAREGLVWMRGLAHELGTDLVSVCTPNPGPLGSRIPSVGRDRVVTAGTNKEALLERVKRAGAMVPHTEHNERGEERGEDRADWTDQVRGDSDLPVAFVFQLLHQPFRLGFAVDVREQLHTGDLFFTGYHPAVSANLLAPSPPDCRLITGYEPGRLTQRDIPKLRGLTTAEVFDVVLGLAPVPAG